MIIGKYDIGDLAGKLKASDHITRFISTLSSRIIQEECIKKVAHKLDLKESLLLEEMLKKRHENERRAVSPERDYDAVKKESEDKKIVPLKKIEIEALKLIISGTGDQIDGLLSLGPDYFRFGDTRALFIAVREEFQKAKEENKKVNFPLKITSGAVENEEVRKLYNFILFSEPHFESGNADRMCSEVISNLKGIHISEEIEKIRKKMIEYEKNRNAGSGVKEESSTEYDELYRKLIELEKEKINLKLL